MAIPIFVFEAGYSKDQELEADREGTRLSVEAGYSANGAVRMFETFDRMYRRYMGQTAAKPGSPEEEVSQVALQTLEGYFRSHPLPSERIAQIQKLIASEGWPAHAERDLGVAYVFWTERAETALNAHKYPEAERLASQSLKMRADQPEAWQTMAKAQFAQANFSDAASSYRKLLQENVRKPEDVRSFALALAAADRQRAAVEFRGWMASISDGKPAVAEVTQAGLDLLAGDANPAHRLESQLQVSSDTQVADSIGELAWWYYLGGEYERASQLAGDAVQMRPGNSLFWTRRAWTEIEIRRYSDAIQSASNGDTGTGAQYERTMVQAVAHWLANETNEALSLYSAAAAGQPEWENPNWVKGLYSPLVARSVEAMKAERERQKKQRMAEKR